MAEPEWQILLVAEVADWFDDLTKNDPARLIWSRMRSTGLRWTAQSWAGH